MRATRLVGAVRSRKGWTQAQLARALGTDPGTVSRWERGVSVPRPSAEKTLRRLLGEVRSPRKGSRIVVDPSRRLDEIDRAKREQEGFRETAGRPS